MYTAMTLHDDSRGDVTIPLTLRPAADRESIGGAIADCVLVADVGPARVRILLRTDGSWAHWTTEFPGSGNSYFHIDDARSASRPATESQRRTLARWWLRIDPRPYGAGVGATVYAWAFEGRSADQLSAEYGDGSKVFLA